MRRMPIRCTKLVLTFAAPVLLAASPLQGQAPAGDVPTQKLMRLDQLTKAGDAEALPVGWALVEEASTKYKQNTRWQGEVAAFYGAALKKFGDFEEAGKYYTQALGLLKDGMLYMAIQAEAAEVERELAAVEAWRSHYAAMVAEARAAAAAGREPPVLTLAADLDGDPIFRKGVIGRSHSFRVQEVVKNNQDELVVRIDATALDRLVPGDTGYVRAVMGNAGPRGFADATVVSAGDRTLVRIDYREGKVRQFRFDPAQDWVVFENADRYQQPKEGSSYIRVKALGNVGFASPVAGKAHYYDIRHARIFDDSVPPMLTAARMARDLRAAAVEERTLPMDRRAEVFNEILEFDQFEGLTVLEALERTTAANVADFLSTVMLSPGDWDLLDTYIDHLLEMYGDLFD